MTPNHKSFLRPFTSSSSASVHFSFSSFPSLFSCFHHYWAMHWKNKEVTCETDKLKAGAGVFFFCRGQWEQKQDGWRDLATQDSYLEQEKRTSYEMLLWLWLWLSRPSRRRENVKLRNRKHHNNALKGVSIIWELGGKDVWFVRLKKKNKMKKSINIDRFGN